MTTTAVLHAICAVAFMGLSALILLQAKRSRTGLYLSGACAITSAWAAIIAATWPDTSERVAEGLDLVRSLAWCTFVLHLYRRSVTVDRILSRAFGTMALIGVLMAVLLILLSFGSPSGEATLSSAATAARLGIAVCAILLIENLWFNTDPDARWQVKLACIALGALFVYDILLSADAMLTRRISVTLYGGRALASLLVVPLLAVGAARNRTWRIDIHVSRTAAFHSATLVASGIFFLSLAAAGEVFRRFGADWGGVAEIGLIFAGVLVVGVLLTSGSARSWVRATVVDHFFSHRYDYRREWIRCTATLSVPDTYVPLHVRAIRATAEIVDSPGGALFVRDQGGTAFHWAGSWNMPADATPLMSDHPSVELFGDGHGILELDHLPAAQRFPEFYMQAWLAVPLRHGEWLIGFVLLERSRAEFRLDPEVFDVLRTVGRMVAGFIAEQRMTEALTQGRQLHEYAKRFAFVAHDIKNLSSQLSLLLANAEIHLQNPDFQRDMLGTVRSSVQKIGTLLQRLQEPELQLADAVSTPGERLTGLVAACQRGRDNEIRVESDGLSVAVAMAGPAFDAVVTHLLTNALDASDPGTLVRVRMRHETRRLLVDVIDCGTGMTPEFIRDQLFRPFGTLKHDGTGIGAYQARELLREAGGDLLVMSEFGTGTTMRILVPLAGAVAEAAAVVRRA